MFYFSGYQTQMVTWSSFNQPPKRTIEGCPKLPPEGSYKWARKKQIGREKKNWFSAASSFHWSENAVPKQHCWNQKSDQRHCQHHPTTSLSEVRKQSDNLRHSKPTQFNSIQSSSLLHLTHLTCLTKETAWSRW